MPFSDTYANNILNYLFGGGSLSAPTQIYLGLHRASGAEISGGGYARVLIRKSGSSYPNVMGSASGRAISNNAQINYNKATTDWGYIGGFGIYTTKTNGEPIFWGDLELTEEEKAAGGLFVEAGSVALFDANTLKITFSETDAAAE